MERNANATMIDSAEKNDATAFELVLVKRIPEEYLTKFNAEDSVRKKCKQKVPSVFFKTVSTLSSFSTWLWCKDM